MILCGLAAFENFAYSNSYLEILSATSVLCSVLTGNRGGGLITGTNNADARLLAVRVLDETKVL